MAAGSPCENIDFRMCGEADAQWRLARAAAEADLILVEGVMGLHDGEPSAAVLALLVVIRSIRCATQVREAQWRVPSLPTAS